MMIKNLVRKNILNLKPYTSARDLYSKGLLLDANENSFGSTFNEIKGLYLNRYPDPHQKYLKELIGNYLEINAANLFFGVGSDEIIDLLIKIFCEPKKDKIIITEPTYGMYRVAADINNVGITSVLLTDEFQLDIKKFNNKFIENVKIIFLCSPNNPTGNVLYKKDILHLCKNINAIIVVDEAYIDFAENISLAKEIINYHNLIILRTFSKAWGLAGIRLGYCIANDFIINTLFKVKAPYNINSLTQYALTKAVRNKKIRDNYVRKIIKQKNIMHNELSKLAGITKVFDSNTNFLLIKCQDAKNVLKKLLSRGIIIRDRSNQPMLENCLRITIGTEEQNKTLLDALRKVLK